MYWVNTLLGSDITDNRYPLTRISVTNQQTGKGIKKFNKSLTEQKRSALYSKCDSQFI